MPPYPMCFQGRARSWRLRRGSWAAGSPGYLGRFQMVPTRACRQPAVAAYVRRLDEPASRAFAITVKRIQDGCIVEVTAFRDPAYSRPSPCPWRCHRRTDEFLRDPPLDRGQPN